MEHFININQIIYGNLFSENDYTFSKGKKQHFLPSISYRVEQQKHSIEAYALIYVKNIKAPIKSDLNDFDFFANSGFGLNYGYKIMEKDRVEMRVFGGVNYASIYYEIHGNTLNTSIFFEKWTPGLQAGLNTMVYFWKGAFVNANIRYSNYPWLTNSNQSEKVNFHQNLLVGLGLGYRLRRKRK